MKYVSKKNTLKKLDKKKRDSILKALEKAQ